MSRKNIKEIKLEETQELPSNMERSEMDRVLAYKNLLAAEDHLREIDAKTEEELAWKDSFLRKIEHLRTYVMPPVEDRRYHCLVKHLSAANIALEEVDKTMSELISEENVDTLQAKDHANESRRLLSEALEKLWGHEVVNCRRCGK